MPRNSFIQMTKLHNVRGRIYYISSPKKQENLYAVYETTDRNFWTDLAKYNQAEFKKSGTEGKCIEARELIIALPESFTEYPPDRLLQIFTDHFRLTERTVSQPCITISGKPTITSISFFRSVHSWNSP